MATRRKPKVKKIRFELSRSAIGGISVVTFCLFLWMFLLGVWAGQSLLIPTYGSNPDSVAAGADRADIHVIRADKKPIKKRQ